MLITGYTIVYILMISEFVTEKTQMQTIERQQQHILNNLQKCSIENGFRFSKSKTKCMHFLSTS